MLLKTFAVFNYDEILFQMHIHGDDMKKLHKFIPVEFLPSNYGGTLPAIDYSGKEWYPATENYTKNFAEWNTFGFK